MSGVVMGGDDRAVIHHTGTGEEMSCSVPTALENVANSGGLYAHGHKPADLKAKPPEPVAEPEPVIPLVEEDVLPLPAAEPEPEVVEPAAAAPAVDPLDHDANGKKGGAKKPVDPERAAVIAALKAAQIKYFAGAPTEKLKALLPA